MHIIAEITYRCPARCPFCPIRKELRLTRRLTMDIISFKKVLELFVQRFPDSRRLLTISGGEPTMLEGLPKYVEIAHDFGFTVTVATNCYNPERLLKAKPDFVQISLDSVNNRHNDSRGLALWYKVIKVLEYVKNKELQGFIRYTLTKENITDLYTLKSKLEALGLNIKIYAMPIRGCPEKAPSESDILNVIRDKVAVLPTRCPAGKGQFVITPDLRVLDYIFHRKLLGKLEKISDDELDTIIEAGRKLPPFPCGEPYWWAGEGD